MRNGFTIPLQTEVAKYIREKKGWPEKFCVHYAEKFWCHYQSNGWKVSGKAAMKDWKACFNAQWQTLKYKEDIELLNKMTQNRPIESSGEFEEIDSLLAKYKQHPTEVKFEEFGKYYDFLREHKLMNPIGPEKVAELKALYGEDKFKCRCACVQMTFNGYCNNDLTFGQIMKIRKQLA